MHLLIFDPHERGHYLTFVRYLLDAAAIASRVTLVLRHDIRQLEPFRQQLYTGLGRAELNPFIRTESYRLGDQLTDDFTQALARHKPDHVWVPSGDLLARHLGLNVVRRPWRGRGGTEAEVGLIEARFHRPPRRARGHLRFWFDRTMLAAGPWTRIHTIDPTLGAWAASHPHGPMTSRVALLPDPVDPYEPLTRERAREALGLPADGKYVGAVGSHAMPRKGSPLLIEAFARANLPANHRLLLAGPLGAELAGRLQSEFAPLIRDRRIVTLDRYLDEAELMWSLSASDLVCTPYFDHMGSSGIVLRAAQAERPVLVPRMGWLGEVVPSLQLGDADDILDVDALARRLGPALEASARFTPSPAGKRLVIYSDSRNFGARWSARLRERLGLPAAAEERTWSWVLNGR